MKHASKINEIKRNHFKKIFTENLEFIISELSASEKNVFFTLLMCVDCNNLYLDNANLRKYIASVTGISTSNLSRVLLSLEKNGVVVRLNSSNAKNMKRAFWLNSNLAK